MTFEINVAKKKNKIYRHYFKVTVPYGNVKNVYNELKEKFTDCKLTVTRWDTVGEEIDVDTINY